MDARCQQIYTAVFDCENGAITRLTDDEALPLTEVAERLSNNDRPLMVIGDGAALTYEALKEQVPFITPAPPAWRYQHAVGVANAAVGKIARGEVISGDTLLPTYLRLPQAQRELRLRQNIQD
jgi:tRNA threonylcarbamoyladenosine biosynthesis protein TsaB